jgi:hypothetical protein
MGRDGPSSCRSNLAVEPDSRLTKSFRLIVTAKGQAEYGYGLDAIIPALDEVKDEVWAHATARGGWRVRSSQHKVRC